MEKVHHKIYDKFIESIDLLNLNSTQSRALPKYCFISIWFRYDIAVKSE